MKALIKTIIALFFVAISYTYMFTPAILYAKDAPMSEELPFYMAWFIFSNVIVGIVIAAIPLYYIIKWIDKNFK